MRNQLLLLIFAGALCCAGTANAQDDSPSLGDVARQSRQQKQQKDAQAAKEAQTSASSTGAAPAADPANAQPAKPSKKVITNDEMPGHVVATRTADPQKPADSQQQSAQPQTEDVKSQVAQIKGNIASLQSQIADLEQSIHYTGSNCVYGCAQWNENQQKKQSQVDTLKQQLAQQQDNLEQVQESARKQGLGSSVYDPD